MRHSRWTAVALAAAMLLPLVVAPFGASSSPGMIGAVVRLSDRFDMSHDAHVDLVASGSSLLATWESDRAEAIYPESALRLEMGWGARFDGANWSPAFGTSYVGGATVEAHFGRSAAGPGHFLVAYNLFPNGFTVVRFGLGGELPEATWLFEPREGSVAQRPAPAVVGGRDVAAVVTNDPRFAPPGLRAAVMVNLTAGHAIEGEVIATFPTLALVDARVFELGGAPAALLEVEPEQASPHELLLSVRRAGGWTAPVRVQVALEGLSRLNADVAVLGTRAFAVFERQRQVESSLAIIVLSELFENGSTRELTVSPSRGSHSHLMPDLALMGDRAFVSWETNDDSLGLGSDVDAYYRGVNLTNWTLGPIRPLNPPDENATDGDAAVASDGSRLFGLWITDSPAYTDGLEDDVVARYLEGDFDLDGLEDAVDPDPERAAVPPAPGGAPPSVGFTGAAAVAGVATAASLLLLRARRRGH